MLYERIFKEQQRLESRITELQAQINMLPKGKLICSQGNNCYKWYNSEGSSKIYIPKKQRAYAEQLAIKKYLGYILEDLKHEKRALEFYLKHHTSKTCKAEELLTSDSGYKELLTSYFKPLTEELAEWMNSPYEQNLSHTEHLIHKTCTGGYVRSKSETMISLFLHTNQIPFRYECALRLGETTIYPDFTIRHPLTGKKYYWEHFGRMDDSIYSQNTCSKLQLYIIHGIIPSINLITTYETQEHPLCTEDIEKIIEHYFT